MITMATMSSTTARVSSSARSAEGIRAPAIARTARQNATSVAVGIAQPRAASVPAVNPS
jgi:hypothetical protein